MQRLVVSLCLTEPLPRDALKKFRILLSVPDPSPCNPFKVQGRQVRLVLLEGFHQTTGEALGDNAFVSFMTKSYTKPVAISKTEKTKQTSFRVLERY